MRRIIIIILIAASLACSTNAISNTSGTNNDSTAKNSSAKQLPLAPSGISGTSTSCTSISLQWQDNAQNEEGYRIYRNGTFLSTLKSNSQTYRDYGLKAATRYKYTVKSYNQIGESNSISCFVQTINPPLNINIDYIGVKFDHDPTIKGPGDIRLFVMISDGINEVHTVVPSENIYYILNDYETIEVNRLVFSTPSVGDHIKISIVAYEDDDNWITNMLLDNLPTLLSTFLNPTIGELVAGYQELAGKPLFADNDDLVGSYDGFWSSSQSWGIGQYNCVGTDDFRLCLSVWSEPEPAHIPKPTLLPLTVFDGWYVNGVKVDTTTQNNTITARISLSSGEPGQYEIMIGRDVPWGTDKVIETSLFTYDGTTSVKELSFTPLLSKDTYGYWVHLYKDGMQVSNFPNTYPPRLLVNGSTPTQMTEFSPTPVETPKVEGSEEQTPGIAYFELGVDTAYTKQQSVKVWAGADDDSDIHGYRTLSYERRFPGSLVRLYEEAPEGMVFIIVNATVINYDSRSVYISYDDFSIVDNLGYKYRATEYQGKGQFEHKIISAGTSHSGKVVFQVPETSLGFEVQYTLPGSPPLTSIWPLPD